MRAIKLFGVAALALAPVSAATVGIGTLQVLYNNGYQQVGFLNLTGSDQGCQNNGDPGEFPVCTGVNISSWTLQINFAAQGGYANSLFNSPLVFTSSGAGDSIGPFNGLAGFTGGSSGTWQIPLTNLAGFYNNTEPACPPCDYQISSIEFSGTISAIDIPFKLGQTGGATPFNAGDPATYTVFNAQTTFDTIWNVPAGDYSSISSLPDPSFFADFGFAASGADVLVSDQQQLPPSVPEPGSILLLFAGVATIAFAKRSRKT